MSKLEHVQPEIGSSSPKKIAERSPRILDVLKGVRGQLLVAVLLTLCASCTDGDNNDQCENPFSPDAKIGDNSGASDTEKDAPDCPFVAPGIPPSTIPMLRHSVMCNDVQRDEVAWCENHHVEEGEQPCEGFEPKDKKEECETRYEACLADKFQFSKYFHGCVDDLPVPPGCDLQPYSGSHDADGDGLPDHSELWHLHTNPCEPCSYGDTEPCDADADHDKDGIPNIEDYKTIGGCISHVATDSGCG